jgi:hypothetical protein
MTAVEWAAWYIALTQGRATDSESEWDRIVSGVHVREAELLRQVFRGEQNQSG